MTTKKKLGKPYTAADLKKMRALAKSGVSARIAAEELGRSRGAVAYKAMIEGISFRSIAQKRGTQRRPQQRQTLARLATERHAQASA